MSSYDKVRFIGYAVPTTPADMVAVGDPNGSGAVAGTYRGTDDFAADIAARAGFLKVAVDTAKAALPAEESGVLTVFLAPEFYWHGQMGPYVHTPGDPDPGDEILALLQRTFPAEQYPDLLLVLGSVITAEVGDIDTVMSASTTTVRNDIVRALGEGWNAADGPLADVIFDMFVNFVKNGHAYPQVEVRNRALIISATPAAGITGDFEATALTTEKYFDSNEDFLLWDVTGKPVITEQMTAYPVIDISAGDFKHTATDPFAVFRYGGDDPVDIAVEVCLDHSDHRIRKGVARNPWPERDGGIDLHLIPSCGMQLHVPSVGARAGGWAFNCDGQYTLGAVEEAGTPQRDVVSGVPSAYTDYFDPSSSAYGAHTQLARVKESAVGSAQHGAGAHDATFEPAPEVSVTVVPIAQGSSFDEYFAGGPGALHIYGLTDPLPLRG
ncbi:MAG: hypothetical protein ABWY03_02100 [Microbacterium sp.]